MKVVLDTDRIDEAVPARLHLGLHGEFRAWKGFDWEAMNRLHEKGMISDPVGKAKSVVFTEGGQQRSGDLFKAMFTNSRDHAMEPGEVIEQPSFRIRS